MNYELYQTFFTEIVVFQSLVFHSCNFSLHLYPYHQTCYFGSTSLVSNYITLFVGYPKMKFANSQMLENMRGLLQAADEKRQASLAELSAKHQKVCVCLLASLPGCIISFSLGGLRNLSSLIKFLILLKRR
jgi:hypothetical protein